MRKRVLAALTLVAACSQEELIQEAADQQPSSNVVLQPPLSDPAGFRTNRRPVSAGVANEQDRQAARQVLLGYFALVQAGRTESAAELWWDQGHAAAFHARLRRFGEFQPSVAAPGRTDNVEGVTHIDISLQLLRKTPSGVASLSGGTAVVRRANEDLGTSSGSNPWLIDK